MAMFVSHFEKSFDAVFIVEWGTRRILSCNDAVSEVFGYLPSEVIGRSSEFLHLDSEHYERFGTISEPVLAQGESFRLQFQMRRRDGTAFNSLHLVSPIKTAGGRIEQVLSIVRDLDRYGERHTLARFTTDDSPMALLETDLESGAILQANPSCRALFGLSPDEDLRNYKVSDFYIRPKERETLIQQLRAKGRIEGEEVEFKRKSGEPFWAAVWLSLVTHRNKPALLGGMVEITERKRALEAALANEARYRDLAEMTADWFWETDLENRFTFFLQTGLLEGMGIDLDWAGRRRDEFQRALGAVPNVTGIVEPFMARRVPFSGIRFSFVHPERGEVWMELSGKPIRDGAGEVTGYRGVGKNITREIEHLREIEAKEQLLRSFTDNAPATIYVKDLEGRYLLANAKLREVAAGRAKEVIGLKAEDIFDPESARAFAEQDREVVRSRAPQSFVVTSRVSGQEPHILHITKFPVLDHRDAVVGVGGINIDVTERHRLESELEQLQRLESVGQLTGGVAHDFNNLLSVVLSNAEFLQDRPMDVTGKQALQSILEAAEQGAHLTRELLAFSRKQRLEARRSDPKAIAERLDTLLRRTIPAGIDLEIELDETVQPVLVDSRKLENAIINLVVNSRDALGQSGKIRVSLSNARFSDDETALQQGLQTGDYLLVRVADNGPGIPKDLLDKVLEPFFTTKEPGQGTGLGLSSAYGFARQSGGNLIIRSAPGEGTEVSIYLPRAAGPCRARPAEDEPESTGERISEPARILVVEDDHMVRAGICLLLRQLRHEVADAENAEEALKVIERAGGRFDLVISDMIMPGALDGLALAQEIERRYPGVSILLTSGYAEADLAGERGEATGFPLLQKPYRKGDLLQAVQTLLGKERRLAG